MVSLLRVRPTNAIFVEAVRVAPAKKSAHGRVLIKVIEPGQGATGFYTPPVLHAACLAGKFDNAPIMWNHPGEQLRSEKSPDSTQLAGYIAEGTAKYMQNGPKGPGVYAEAVTLKKAKDDVADWIDTPFGLSIHASGELERPGDITSNVIHIDKVHSVDLVVRPGAGGAIVEVLESELTSVPVWNSHPLESPYAYSIIRESESDLIRVMPGVMLEAEEKKSNWTQRSRSKMEETLGPYLDPKHDNSEQRITRNAFRRVTRRQPITEDEPMALQLAYQLYEDSDSGNQYLYLGNENDQGFQESAENIWSMMESDEEPQLFRDGQGNHFALVQDGGEMEEASTMSMLNRPSSSSRRQPGRPVEGPSAALQGQASNPRVQRQRGAPARSSTMLGYSSPAGPSLGDANMRTRGNVAGRRGMTAVKGFAGRNKRKLIAGGAAGLGLGVGGAVAGKLMGKNRKEEENYVEGEIYEQDGQYFQYLGESTDEIEEMSHMASNRTGRRRMHTESEEGDPLLAAINGLREDINDVVNGPARQQQIAEAANEYAVGSNGARHMIIEAAQAWAETEQDAAQIGNVIGRIIEQDRAEYAKANGFGDRGTVIGWNADRPAVIGGPGAMASGGGNLMEQSPQDFDKSIDKMISSVFG